MKLSMAMIAITSFITMSLSASVEACSKEQLKNALFIPHDNITVLKLGENMSSPYLDTSDNYEVISTAIYYEGTDHLGNPVTVAGTAKIRTGDCVTTKLSLQLLSPENLAVE